MSRIHSNRYYVIADHPGISGFRDYGSLSYSVVTGMKARTCRHIVRGEFLPIAEDIYRLRDGRLPEYQATARTHEALEWLKSHPFQSIARLDHATRSQEIAPNYTEL